MDEIERRIVKDGLVSEITIHVDPVDAKDEFSNTIKKELEEKLKIICDSVTLHDFRTVHCGDTIKRVTFDITVPYDLGTPDDEIKDTAIKIVKGLSGNPEADIYIDRS